MEQVLQVARALLESVFGGEVGSDRFSIMISLPMFGALMVAWFLSKAFGSKQGVLASLIALLLPLLLGVAAYSIATVYVVPEIGKAWAVDYLGFGMLVLFALLTVVFVSKRLWDIGALASLVIVLFALSAAAMGYFAIDSMMSLSDQADDTVSDRKQILEDAGQ